MVWAPTAVIAAIVRSRTGRNSDGMVGNADGCRHNRRIGRQHDAGKVLARFAATVRGETDLKKQTQRRKDAKTQRKSYDRLRLSVLAFL